MVGPVLYGKLDSKAGDTQHISENVSDKTEHKRMSIYALIVGSNNPYESTEGKHPFPSQIRSLSFPATLLWQQCQ